MKRLLIVPVILFLFAAYASAARVTIIVNSLPANTPENSQIYFAGSINGWNPGHADYILQPNGQGKPEIVLEGTGTMSFKFTRGSWATVEGNSTGGMLPNRTFTFGQADTLLVSILSWEGSGGASTAASNVKIMDTSFMMPQFNRTRRIWVYLPPDYESSGLSYPVLYMHDGQNLFDQATAYSGEWQVDETLNEIAGEGKRVPIVVGIDNGGGDRIAEYTPWANSRYGGGDGELYGEFIAETLKPYIDLNYRTLSSRENTGVMGSSLGGLISFYIAHKYQDIFSKAGVFSPSFWFNDSVYSFAAAMGKQHEVKYYIMGGTDEGSSLIEQMTRMMDELKTAGVAESNILLKTVIGGQHNEALWRSQFREAYEWLFSENTTGFIPAGEQQDKCRMILRGRQLNITGNCNKPDLAAHIQLYDLHGKQVFSSYTTSKTLLLPHQLNGMYLVMINFQGQIISEKVLLL